MTAGRVAGAPAASIRVAVDIGGTFTDLAAYDGATGAVSFGKALSTPQALVEGVAACVDKARVDLPRTLHVVHGSTVAINAVLQKTGARTALVTTEGFRDVLEIGRANRPDTYNLAFEKPIALVPRTLRFEIPERMSADGRVLRRLDRAAAKTVVAALRRSGVDAVAVCFLHAYANPEHEIVMGRMLRTALPGVFVTLSHEITREFREYERSSTTVLNAFVGPLVSRSLTELERRLEGAGFGGSLFLMQSNGGVMSAARAKVAPVAMMESGPAGGVIGAAALGRALGHPNVIAFDMGGTTAKACLVERGLPKMADGYFIGGYATGYPMRLPIVDIVEVGTGGGSIAWIDAAGALKVGPRSAGAEPGPVCYRRGGTEPTVTDANLVIGRLNAARFLGGELTLDVDGARLAIERRVARPFEMELATAAHGIIRIAEARMSFAVRAVTLERGYDPRDFALVAFGGAGPAHAAAIARELRIPKVIVPPQPGHFSALGMLMTDVRRDYVRTYVRNLEALKTRELDELFGAMEAEGAATLTAEGLGGGAITFVRALEMRYQGQEYTVTVPIPSPLDPAAPLADVVKRFHDAYDLRYGHSAPQERVQLVSLRLTSLGAVRKPDFTGFGAARGIADGGVRSVYFETAGDYVACPVHHRETLAAGTRIEGPAIIEEYASTTVLHPGDRVTVEGQGCLVIDVATEPPAPVAPKADASRYPAGTAEPARPEVVS